MSKFDTNADEVLMYLASMEGWADRTGGDSSDGPIGWFGTISIGDWEIKDLHSAAEDAFSKELLQGVGGDLVGHFLVREATDGQVTVQRFTTQDETNRAFDELWSVLMSLEAVSNEPSI